MTLRLLSLSAGAAALLAALPAFAQSGVLTVPPPPGAAPASIDPVEALGRYLRVLAVFPRNLDALAGAGRSALAIGDGNAAISFFARAQDIAPTDGRIKAGLASALVQMEQPKTALKLFDQAVSLGVPEGEIASDRGLARDLRGDTRRAQVDYALALRARPDDETTRRLAVSQAIGGDRAAAMATLDPLLRRQDRAAWRVRAFVLALTGDRDGAEVAARNAMPLPQAQALMPFFARLSGLRPGEKAAAVHLGQFPSDGRSGGNRALFAQADDAASPAGPRSDVPLIPAGTPLGAAASADLSETLSRAPRRRPGAIDAVPHSNAPAPGAALALPVAPGNWRMPSQRAMPAQTAIGAPPAAVPPAARLALTVPPRPVAAPGPAAAPPAAPSRPTAAVPLIAAPARAAAMLTMPAMAPPVVAAPAAAPLIAAPSSAVAMLTLPAMAPPLLAAPAPATQVAVGGPAIQPIELPASAAASPPADAPIVATRFGPALAEPAAAPSAPVRLAAVEPISQPPPARAMPVAEAPKEKAPPKPKPAAKDVPPPAKERPVRVDAKDKPGAAEAEAAKDKPLVKDAKAGRAREKLAAKDEQDAKAVKDKDRKAKDAAKQEAAAAKDKPSDAAGGERYWVQVASGANKTDLDRAWEKTRARAPKLLTGRTTYTSPWKASNRLLVGPFKTEDEAQGFVNTLGKAGMGSMQFTSRARTKVERLSGN